MSNSTNCLITTCVIGGSGFIGRAVIHLLLQSKRRVVVIGRQLNIEFLSKEVEYIQYNNTLSKEIIKKVFAKSDEVINLAYATVPQTSFQNPVNDILLNLPDTVQLFELAIMYSISKFICVSSGGTVYGRTAATPITEEHDTLPLSPYGITKLATEKYAHMYFEIGNLPVIIVRPSNAYGQYQRPYVGQGFIATAIASILDDKTINIFGELGTVRDYLHVSDVASGIISALLYGIPGEVYNIGSGIGLTNKDVVNMLVPLADALNKPIKVQHLAERLFDVPYNVLNADKLNSVSGWKPKIGFAEGLRQTWDWYIARKQHKE